MLYQQNYADVLKSFIGPHTNPVKGKEEENRELRKHLYGLIQRFEGAEWQPEVFDWALEMIAPASFDFEAKTFNSGGGRRMVLAAVEDVLNHYLRLVDPQNQLFSTQEAAKLLDMTVDGIKYHVHRSKQLKGQRFGNSLVFTREELEQFQQQRKPAGRPAGSTTKR